MTRDLGSHGAFIFASDPPPCGTHLVLQAFLPARGGVRKAWIAGKGQVVRTEVHRDGRSGFAVGGVRFIVKRGKPVQTPELVEVSC